MKNAISASPSYFGPASPTPLKQYLGVGEASRVGRRNELRQVLDTKENGECRKFLIGLDIFLLYSNMAPAAYFSSVLLKAKMQPFATNSCSCIS